MKFKNIISLSMTLLPIACFSTTTSDFQSWNNITVTGALKDNVSYWAEAQARFGEDISRLSQSIVRPGIGYQLDKKNSIWAGYAWIYTTEPFASDAVHEHRIWQQYIRNNDYNWIKTSSRTRLEQRFISNVSTVGWRLRQFLGLQLPIKQMNNVFISATEEVFIRLNNTMNDGSNKGFDQNRLFLGLGFKLANNWSLEAGYQNQLINQANASNFSGSTISAILKGNLS